MQDISVIVRSVGEVTEQRLVDDLQDWFGKQNVSLLKNITPHPEAIRQTILLAKTKTTKWTLAVDADVLFDKDKLISFINKGDKIAEKNTYDGECRLFCLLPDIYDNFFDKPRSAGVHLYYTSNLEKGLKYIDEKSLRAETFMIRSMGKEGYRSYFVKTIVGIHDFFQDYSDIVAKGVLHARKHSNITELMNMWQTNKNENMDYYWIYNGALLGSKHQGDSEFANDREYINQIIEKANLDIPARKPATDEEVLGTINKYINQLIVEELSYAVDNSFKWRHIINKFLKLDLFKKLKQIKDRYV